MLDKDCKSIISIVLPGSIAEEAGIEKGDKLLTINGEPVYDIFDYRYLSAEEELLLELQKSDGEIWEIEIEKDQYEDLGIEFECPMIEDAKSCTNKCIFCFIDQLPNGMRESLYFKDDDSRLSFLTGNYVTLTNMSDRQLERVIKYKMSPVNISVHTTNPDLRVFMLNNKFAGEIIKKVRMLTDGGILVNCQIVLCRNINDKDELDKTIFDLATLHPKIGSISVVPVGITKYRDSLYKLEPYDKKSSIEVISQITKWQERFLEEYGTRLVYAADEFYIMSGMDLPGYKEYEDFPQIENGVGLMAQFIQEFFEYLDNPDISLQIKSEKTISVATGALAYSYIRRLSDFIAGRINGLKINVYEIKNCFFGENVTVAGLLTGTDIMAQLSGRDLGEKLLISRSMLKAGEDIFLDDCTVKELEENLKVKVCPVENNGKEFIKNVIE